MENKEISLGKVFKVGFHRWKLFLIITCSITVVGTLALIFGYNKTQTSYQTNFEYNSPSLSGEKYSDGSDFHYQELISEDNLLSIQSSSAEYSEININMLLTNNKISISKVLDENNSTTSKTIYCYTIKAQANYFPSEDVAKKFIKDIANSAIVKDKNLVTNCNLDTNIKYFDLSLSLDEKIDYLLQQSEDLINAYENYIGNDDQISKYEISDELLGVATANCNAIKNIMSENKATVLKGQITTYGLAYDYKSLDADVLNAKIDSLQAGKSLNQTKIDTINNEIASLGSGVQIAALSQQVEDLILKNADIQIEIDKLTNQIPNVGREASEFKEHNDFIADITTKRNDLEKCVNSYKSFLYDFYITNSNVVYTQASIVVPVGNISTALCVIIPLLIGVIVAFIVNLIVDRKMLYE